MAHCFACAVISRPQRLHATDAAGGEILVKLPAAIGAQQRSAMQAAREKQLSTLMELGFHAQAPREECQMRNDSTLSLPLSFSFYSPTS